MQEYVSVLFDITINRKKERKITMEYVDFITPMKEYRAKEFKKYPTAWDKDGNLIEDRNQYLKSLPKDKEGLPVISKEEFDALACEFNWEQEFIHEYVLDQGLISADDYDEYYEITD